MPVQPTAPAVRRLRRLRTTALPGVVLVLSLAATLAVALYVDTLAGRKDRLRFDNRVRSVVASLEHRLESYPELVRFIERLLAVGGGVDARELRLFADALDLEGHYAGVRAFGFALLPAAASAAGDTALPTPDAAAGGDVPRRLAEWSSGVDEEREHVVSALRGTPPPAGGAARREAMERAAASDDVAVSDVVPLSGEDGAGSTVPGVVLYLPLRPPPSSPEAAQSETAGGAAVAGFVYAVLDLQTLLARSLAAVPPGDLMVEVYADPTPTADELLYATGELASRRPPRFALERDVNFADRRWSVTLASTPQFSAGSGRTQALVVFALGSVFALLLFFTTRSQVRARTAAEGQTAELRRFQDELRKSGEQYRRLVEVSPEATYLVRDLDFAFANSAGIELLGVRSEDELLGRPVLDFVEPEDRAAVERTLRAVERHRESAALADHRWHREGGDEVQVELAAVRTLFEGRPAAQVVLRDVTERRRQEEELHRLLYRQRRDRDELETMHRIGRILSAELDVDRLRSALAEEAAAVLGARFGAFVTAEPESTERYRVTSANPEELRLPQAGALLDRVVTGGKMLLVHDLRKDDELTAALPELRSVLGAPIVSRSGEVLGGMVFGHPQTGAFGPREARIVEGIAAQGAVALDNANLYLATAEARSQAEAASRSKDEFLATLSHELRTPLAAIVNWAQVLRRGTCDEKRLTQGLETILRNARMQAQLMDDLLDVSRIVSGKMRLRVDAVDLPEVIDEALESIRPAAEARGIELERHYDPRAGAVRGDADRLQQVVWNLLSNAVKFTPSGGHVTARLERAGDTVEIQVQDDGIGIRDTYLTRVFDRFHQLDSSTQRQRGGLGLGLSIVRHLTELHGGTVRVESPGEGQGSTFIVTLPLAPSETAEEERDITTAVAVREPPSEPSGEHVVLRGVSVLVVDDEPDAREALRQVLELLQAEVYAAGSASEAIDLLRRHRPAVLLSDIAMPGEDGYALIHKVRALPAADGGETPAAAITAFAYEEDRQRALDAGFQLHIAKPVDVDELADAVLRLVGRPVTVADA